jgi:hypothetical protein
MAPLKSKTGPLGDIAFMARQPAALFGFLLMTKRRRTLPRFRSIAGRPSIIDFPPEMRNDIFFYGQKNLGCAQDSEI